MFLMIVGTGAMGKTVSRCAEEDPFFDKIVSVEPTEKNWPEEKADLIIDFSHPKAIKGIYEYCREKGGNIPVVIGTTGQTGEDEEIIRLLSRICPVERRANYSRGIQAMAEMALLARKLLPESGIGIEEVHHTKKKDMPSGTAKTLCSMLDVPVSSVASLRLGNVTGEHKVCFALEDEMLEITHRAFSKRIFAKGAIEAGKRMIKID